MSMVCDQHAVCPRKIITSEYIKGVLSTFLVHSTVVFTSVNYIHVEVLTLTERCFWCFLSCSLYLMGDTDIL